ncbi:MAG: hypothetical protein D6750_10335 [Bacteroidetes bacterium]|jgi:hypothetical protein|nr:MAG: hypothetical protein D6750_10335 [Bacteroidota bacterium]
MQVAISRKLAEGLEDAFKRNILNDAVLKCIDDHLDAMPEKWPVWRTELRKNGRPKLEVLRNCPEGVPPPMFSLYIPPCEPLEGTIFMNHGLRILVYISKEHIIVVYDIGDHTYSCRQCGKVYNGVYNAVDKGGKKK